mmetsp:Transcript_145033/g.377348  ORF Transcript_145033/g.377348 Transcript_145033/m.377348 type:complete len:265 (+) Transcript_145033:1225-2019(+)
MAPEARPMSAAEPPGGPWAAAAAVAVAAVLSATTLQGCDVPHVEGYLIAGNVEVSTHSLAAWRSMPDYWEQNAYVDPETGEMSFNSCMNRELSILEVCSGHGRCTSFDPEDLAHPLFFCKCDDEWGGVECDTRRKRQSIAWFLSLLFGPLALDELYLGIPAQTLTKLLWTVMGCMIAGVRLAPGFAMVVVGWLFDVVRIGTGPVLTRNYRVQEDLPRLAFAICTVLYFSALAFLVALASMYWTVLSRRRHYDQMLCYSSTKVLA